METTITEKTKVSVDIKSMIWILSCTCSIIFSVLLVYFSLKQQISEIVHQGVDNDKYYELQMHNLENKIDVNTIEINEIKRDLLDQKDATNK